MLIERRRKYMPIKIPNDLPATETLRNEHVL